MTFEEIWGSVPAILAEMTTEFVRKANEHFIKDSTSQPTACSLLALRGLSLMRGMEQLLKRDTFDSWDVLMRAYMETLDLLSTFRFDDEEGREHIERWFAEKGKDTWQQIARRLKSSLSKLGRTTSSLPGNGEYFQVCLIPPRRPHTIRLISLAGLHFPQTVSKSFPKCSERSGPTIAIHSEDCS